MSTKDKATLYFEVDIKQLKQQLKQAGKESQKTGDQMSKDFSNSFEKIEKKSGSAFGGIEKQLDNINQKSSKSKDLFRGMASGLSAISPMTANIGSLWTMAGEAIGKAFVNMVKFFDEGYKKFVELEFKIKNIQSLGVDTKAIDSFSEKIRVLATQTGKDVNNIADSFYNLVSGVGEVAKNERLATDFMDNISKSAIAGSIDMKTATSFYVTAYNVYKDSLDSISDIGNVLQTVVKNGVTTAQEASSVFGQMLSFAKPLGVGLKEVGAGFTEITKAGINSAEASTAMSSLLRNLGKKEIQENFKKLGIEIADSSGKLKNLGKIFTQINKRMSEGLDVRGIITEARAQKAFNVLVNSAKTASGQVVSVLESQLSNFDGQGFKNAVDQAFSVMEESTKVQQQKLSAKWNEINISAGESIKPLKSAFKDVSNFIADLFLPNIIKAQNLLKEGSDYTKASQNIDSLRDSYTKLQDRLTLLQDERYKLNKAGKDTTEIDKQIEAVKGQIKTRIDELNERFPLLADQLTKVGNNTQKAKEEFNKLSESMKAVAMAKFVESAEKLTSELNKQTLSYLENANTIEKLKEQKDEISKIEDKIKKYGFESLTASEALKISSYDRLESGKKLLKLNGEQEKTRNKALKMASDLANTTLSIETIEQQLNQALFFDGRLREEAIKKVKELRGESEKQNKVIETRKTIEESILNINEERTKLGEKEISIDVKRLQGSQSITQEEKNQLTVLKDQLQVKLKQAELNLKDLYKEQLTLSIKDKQTSKEKERIKSINKLLQLENNQIKLYKKSIDETTELINKPIKELKKLNRTSLEDEEKKEKERKKRQKEYLRAEKKRLKELERAEKKKNRELERDRKNQIKEIIREEKNAIKTIKKEYKNFFSDLEKSINKDIFDRLNDGLTNNFKNLFGLIINFNNKMLSSLSQNKTFDKELFKKQKDLNEAEYNYQRLINKSKNKNNKVTKEQLKSASNAVDTAKKELELYKEKVKQLEHEKRLYREQESFKEKQAYLTEKINREREISEKKHSEKLKEYHNSLYNNEKNEIIRNLNESIKATNKKYLEMLKMDRMYVANKLKNEKTLELLQERRQIIESKILTVEQKRQELYRNTLQAKRLASRYDEIKYNIVDKEDIKEGEKLINNFLVGINTGIEGTKRDFIKNINDISKKSNIKLTAKIDIKKTTEEVEKELRIILNKYNKTKDQITAGLQKMFSEDMKIQGMIIKDNFSFINDEIEKVKTNIGKVNNFQTDTKKRNEYLQYQKKIISNIEDVRDLNKKSRKEYEDISTYLKNSLKSQKASKIVAEYLIKRQEKLKNLNQEEQKTAIQKLDINNKLYGNLIKRYKTATGMEKQNKIMQKMVAVFLKDEIKANEKLLSVSKEANKGNEETKKYLIQKQLQLNTLKDKETFLNQKNVDGYNKYIKLLIQTGEITPELAYKYYIYTQTIDRGNRLQEKNIKTLKNKIELTKQEIKYNKVKLSYTKDEEQAIEKIKNLKREVNEYIKTENQKASEEFYNKVAKRTQALNNSYDAEIDLESKRYLRGEYTYEEYQEKLKQIDEKYQDLRKKLNDSTNQEILNKNTQIAIESINKIKNVSMDILNTGMDFAKAIASESASQIGNVVGQTISKVSDYLPPIAKEITGFIGELVSFFSQFFEGATQIEPLFTAYEEQMLELSNAYDVLKTTFELGNKLKIAGYDDLNKEKEALQEVLNINTQLKELTDEELINEREGKQTKAQSLNKEIEVLEDELGQLKDWEVNRIAWRKKAIEQKKEELEGINAEIDGIDDVIDARARLLDIDEELREQKENEVLDDFEHEKAMGKYKDNELQGLEDEKSIWNAILEGREQALQKAIDEGKQTKEIQEAIEEAQEKIYQLEQDITEEKEKQNVEDTEKLSNELQFLQMQKQELKRRKELGIIDDKTYNEEMKKIDTKIVNQMIDEGYSTDDIQNSIKTMSASIKGYDKGGRVDKLGITHDEELVINKNSVKEIDSLIGKNNTDLLNTNPSKLFSSFSAPTKDKKQLTNIYSSEIKNNFGNIIINNPENFESFFKDFVSKFDSYLDNSLSKTGNSRYMY